MKQVEFKINDKKKISLYIDRNVYCPTATSSFLISAAKETTTNNQKILDLGCGTGVVGISLAITNKLNDVIYASDLSDNATKVAQLNFYNSTVQRPSRKRATSNRVFGIRGEKGGFSARFAITHTPYQRAPGKVFYLFTGLPFTPSGGGPEMLNKGGPRERAVWFIALRAHRT